MVVYLINMIIVAVNSWLSEINKRKKSNIVFIVVALISLILVSGCRYKVGTDYTTYLEIYVYNGGDEINFQGGEVGFDILVKLLYRISTNPQLLFFVTAVFTNIAMVWFIKKYSVKFSLSMYLYITTFLYYNTMNGLRQYIASAILISGYKYILNGNFKKYFIFIAIAYLFHSSATIMIPIFFIVRGKTYSKINAIVLIIFALAFVFYSRFVNVLFSFMGDSKYGYYGEIMGDTSNGANVIRIIVWILPVALILLYRKRALKVGGKNLEIELNLCMIGMLFMFLAYRHVFYARFCMYFDVYYLLLIPRICSIFDERTNKALKIAIIVGYFAYSTMLLLSGESWIYPYRYTLNLF